MRIIMLTLAFALFFQNLEAQVKLKIGVIQSTTGIAAEDGKTVVQALKLAEEKLRQQNVDVKLLIEDDQTIAKNTISSFYKLKSQGVEAIIGATWDFTTNTLIPIIGQNKLVLFNTSTLPESIHIADSDGLVFTNAISTYLEAAPFLNLLNSKKLKSLIVVYANNSWGETQRKIYLNIAKEQGVRALGEYSSVAFDHNEWRTIIPAIKSKKPEMLLLLLNKNDLETFLRRAKELGLNSTFFASKNAFDALKITTDKSLFEDLCFTYPYEQLKSNTEFVNSYKSKYGENPRIYADNTYDALFLLAKAKELSIQKGIDLKRALMQTTFIGLLGEYQYSIDNSFSRGKSSLMCVVEGQPQVR